MTAIRVSIVIEAAPGRVWRVVGTIEDHVDWMQDATEIRFTSASHEGQGTTFECDTRVGPIRLTDLMEITEWEPEVTMGVRHTGIVTGTGRFTLLPAGPDRTEFRWEEELDFPWYLGGRVAAPIGNRVLAWIWRRNLRRLKAIVEA